MADTERKARDDSKRQNSRKKQKNTKPSSKKITVGEKMKKRSGPRLPSYLRKELNRLNPSSSPLKSDEEIDSDEGEVNVKDVYEYEESAPEEESKKNRRFDPVENFDYELPENFKDENVLSDDDDDQNHDRRDDGGEIGDATDDEVENEDGEKHVRMLQGITGMPSEAFEGKKSKKIVISEAYPESEYNPSHDVLHGDGRISIEDLMDPLHGKSGYSKLRKRMQRMEKKSTVIHAPLPKADQDRLERKVAYEQSKKQISKWEPVVKRNREAPTMFFGEDVDLGFSTVGAIASEFQPRTDIEKKIASIVNNSKIMEAHIKDGSKLLELNKVSFEDEKDRHNRIAKMRNLLFRHEMKAKHIKKIKSKTYRRLLKKDTMKEASARIEMDPEAAKELAMKQEFKRAEERMTLKHKNSSKWAKRILKRGLSAQDEGTRAAISEQLHQHSMLTRKMNSMRDSSSGSSSDESSGEDDGDEPSASSEQQRASKMLEKAKEKTLRALDEEDEMPNTGLLSLPFMARGMKKRKEAAVEEAKLALQELEALSGQLDPAGTETATVSGRRVFGAAKKQAPESSKKIKVDHYYGNSDSENDNDAEEDTDVGNSKSNDLPMNSEANAVLLHEHSETHQNSIFKSDDETIRDPGPKTTYEVAIFAEDTWRKIKSGKEVDSRAKKVDTGEKKFQASVEPVLKKKNVKETVKEVDGDSDTDDEEEMVDGILSLGPKQSYELPSQAQLIHDAFAGDDVEEDFEKDKQEILNEENPEPEKPVLLPGWGQWTHVQKKKGLPSWMVKEHEDADRKRQEALKKRKDAHLKHVIISEKLDKRAEKLQTKSLPYPFTSKEVFEQSIRMPIGPESNPATAIGALIRPEVIKKTGVIIKPIEFEEVNPHEKVEEHKQRGQKQKLKKGKSNGAKQQKKTKNTLVKN